MQNSLIKAQNLEYDPDASNPDPEPSNHIELDSDGDEIEVDPTRDGTINISSSVLYPDTDKSSVKSFKKRMMKNETLRNSVVGKLFMNFKKNTSAKKSLPNGSDFLKKHNNKLRSNYIVRHLDNWRINWDLFIIFLAVYNAI